MQNSILIASPRGAFVLSSCMTNSHANKLQYTVTLFFEFSHHVQPPTPPHLMSTTMTDAMHVIN